MPENEGLDDEKSNLESLEQKLFARGYVPRAPEKRHPLKFYPESGGKSSGESSSGDRDDRSVMEHEKTANASMKTIKKIFAFSFLFFLGAVSVTLYLFSEGTNEVSSQNIDITVNGPVSIKGGDELNLQILVTNNNSSPLEYADLVIEYPEGTRTVSNQTKELTRERDFIGTINPSEVVNRSKKAILFGEQNAEKSIKLTLEYRLKGSNAILIKEKTFSIALSSSPVSLSFLLPDETHAGREISLEVRATSNALAPLKNVLLEMAYPPGFRFKSSSPEVSFGDRMWKLGDLGPGKERAVTIEGVLEGQENEVKSFRAAVGSSGSRGDDKMSATYGTVFRTITVRRPFVGIEVLLGDSKEDDIVMPLGKVTGDILVTNNLAEQITNLNITLKLAGNIIEKATVEGGEGFYDSSRETIAWGKETGEKFSDIEPGATLPLRFSFSTLTLDREEYALAKNPEVNMQIDVQGSRLVSGLGNEEIRQTARRVIRFPTQIDVTPRLTYYEGPFKNSGSLPPHAGKETTYTVTLALSNSSSDVENAVVRARLPSYVRFIESLPALGNSFTFEESAREIVWNAGNLKNGLGSATVPKEASFKISFLPSLSQVGAEPVLVSDIVIGGTDLFTGRVLESIKKELTSSLIADEKAQNGDGIVAR